MPSAVVEAAIAKAKARAQKALERIPEGDAASPVTSPSAP